jgi:hypothetical protein
MRLVPPVCLGAGLLVSFAVAGDTGVRPRAGSADYPVSRPAKNAAIGAALVPADQVKKILPAEISREYVLVEVAVYPQDGAAVDVVALDFALKFGPDGVRYPSTPQEVASAWTEKQPPLPGHGVHGSAEAGVTYDGSNDPAAGRVRGRSTDESVTLTNNQPPGDPPPPPYDPYAVQARTRQKALPEGQTRVAVAGYLYFPVPAKRHKGASLELKYLKDGDTVVLPLPAK